MKYFFGEYCVESINAAPCAHRPVLHNRQEVMVSLEPFATIEGSTENVGAASCCIFKVIYSSYRPDFLIALRSSLRMSLCM